MDGENQPNSRPKGTRGPYVLLVFFTLVAVAAIALWQVAVSQRGKNPPLTIDRLEAAQQRWGEGQPDSYSLRIKLFGQHGGLLTVHVTDGSAELEADPPKILQVGTQDFWNPNAWTVDGMFVRLRRDLEIVENPEFLPPAGTAAPSHGYKTLRADFDEQLGYIRNYKRPQLDQLPALQWQVESFERRSGT